MTTAGSRRKRYSPEQIVAKLREAEKLQGRGTRSRSCASGWGSPSETFYRWRLKFGTMTEAEAARLKVLEQENVQLKKIVANQALDIQMLKDLQRGNW